MRGLSDTRNLLLLVLVVASLAGLPFIASDYLVLSMTRIMVLAVFACGYNLLLGYTGLLSLGHAMFFAAGIYGAGLPAYHLGLCVPLAFVCGVLVASALALMTGLVVLRTARISFMIVTMMFGQAAFLATLQFASLTGGDQGLPLPKSARGFDLGGHVFDLTDGMTRYGLALGLLALALGLTVIILRSPMGRVLIAIRENEARTRMLGFDVERAKLKAFVLSGTIAGMAGAAYALLFGYVGSTFASVQYSIEVLLFTLLGGAGTLLGPLVGTALMTFLIDRLSEWTTAYLLVVGLALIGLTLFFREGLLGSLRSRWLPWLA
ncbi:LIV-I protein H [Hartmannibacter diazotrophicus]|uniref:LIV-I protein H n=1 Tax=Hartmannibacter diazotrophicus TaxID=1482074 RepID=A0A2C9DCJ3_9HYPH|nr:branched-chain amino acid ABC transporter permease [Hartmannibacter diazotrophicus]SON57848.1 LIV-I protein H [Hartmannibacter diazotrophicus]